MPHSSRKKRNPVSAQKRLEVTDDDGWTHVTSGSNVRRVVRTTKARSDREANMVDETELVLSPAEAPARLTFEELEAQYRGYKERWVQSETWQKLRVELDQRIHDQETETLSQDLNVDGIVCIGLGSPSGFLRDGWVDRRAVSLYQLAALETIKDVFTSSFLPLLKKHTDIQLRLSPPSLHLLCKGANRSSSFPIYAQDPVFNNLDRELLESLGMTVVNTPVGFERVTSKTLLFCPGAERKHLDMLLPSNPKLVLGGPLENTESSIIQAYVEKTDSSILVSFSAQEHAFWKMRLYHLAQVKA
ncbi:hypothetical protein N7509_005682 [Penicillium cosmopolitanum]|uniref:SRR1-like domain-containing protein n=1 Tax=Penicillium cosmopolitanum TaxID=1131564 RepID=A0A9W9W2P4_9EURO|nr:uncharacterized protein N7509_005682 [Penicillium cosmopolitanum]KAJ5397569.1 hypothetical protein N7509_005682 [Penicillium cosmopolitanum]